MATYYSKGRVPHSPNSLPRDPILEYDGRGRPRVLRDVSDGVKAIDNVVRLLRAFRDTSKPAMGRVTKLEKGEGGRDTKPLELRGKGEVDTGMVEPVWPGLGGYIKCLEVCRDVLDSCEEEGEVGEAYGTLAEVLFKAGLRARGVEALVMKEGKGETGERGWKVRKAKCERLDRNYTAHD